GRGHAGALHVRRSGPTGEPGPLTGPVPPVVGRPVPPIALFFSVGPPSPRLSPRLGHGPTGTIADQLPRRSPAPSPAVPASAGMSSSPPSDCRSVPRVESDSTGSSKLAGIRLRCLV